MSAQWTATRPDSPFVESAKTAPLGPPPPNGAVAFVTRALDNSVRLHYNAVDDWTRLDRFLVLGSEKSTYYVQARELTRRNAEAVLRCIGNDGPRVVARIVAISQAPGDPPLSIEHGNRQLQRKPRLPQSRVSSQRCGK